MNEYGIVHCITLTLCHAQIQTDLPYPKYPEMEIDGLWMLEILMPSALLLHDEFDNSTNISTLVNNINVSCVNVPTSAICSL